MIPQSYITEWSEKAPHLPTYKEFVLNMVEKLQDEEFLSDTDIILGQMWIMIHRLHIR